MNLVSVGAAYGVLVPATMKLHRQTALRPAVRRTMIASQSSLAGGA